MAISSRFKNIGIILSVAAMGIVALAACNRKTEHNVSVTDPETGEKTNISVSKDMFSKDSEINIKSDQDGASLTINKGTIAGAMPNFIAPYPGATEISTLQASENKGASKFGDSADKMTMLNFKSTENAQKIIDFYTGKLTPHGFTQEASMNMGNMHMATLVNKNSKQVLQIMVSKEGASNSSVVQLIYGSEDE